MGARYNRNSMADLNNLLKREIFLERRLNKKDINNIIMILIILIARNEMYHSAYNTTECEGKYKKERLIT